MTMSNEESYPEEIVMIYEAIDDCMSVVVNVFETDDGYEFFISEKERFDRFTRWFNKDIRGWIDDHLDDVEVSGYEIEENHRYYEADLKVEMVNNTGKDGERVNHMLSDFVDVCGVCGSTEFLKYESGFIVWCKGCGTGQGTVGTFDDNPHEVRSRFDGVDEERLSEVADRVYRESESDGGSDA
jgi:hypothetical protein